MHIILQVPIRSDQIHRFCLIIKIQIHTAAVVKENLIHIWTQFSLDGILPLLRLSLREIDLHVVDRYLRKLIGNDIDDGITDAKARQQQGCTATDAHDHHQKTLAVTEHVTEHHFIQEAEPIPERQMLHEYLFARGRCFGANQLRRYFLQFRTAAVPCDQQGYGGICHHHRKAQGNIQPQLHLGGQAQN